MPSCRCRRRRSASSKSWSSSNRRRWPTGRSGSALPPYLRLGRTVLSASNESPFSFLLRQRTITILIAVTTGRRSAFSRQRPAYLPAFTPLRSRSAIADHLHADAARPARLRATTSRLRSPCADDGHSPSETRDHCEPFTSVDSLDVRGWIRHRGPDCSCSSCRSDNRFRRHERARQPPWPRVRSRRRAVRHRSRARRRRW